MSRHTILTAITPGDHITTRADGAGTWTTQYRRLKRPVAGRVVDAAPESGTARLRLRVRPVGADGEPRNVPERTIILAPYGVDVARRSYGGHPWHAPCAVWHAPRAQDPYPHSWIPGSDAAWALAYLLGDRDEDRAAAEVAHWLARAARVIGVDLTWHRDLTATTYTRAEVLGESIRIVPGPRNGWRRDYPLNVAVMALTAHTGPGLARRLHTQVTTATTWVTRTYREPEQ